MVRVDRVRRGEYAASVFRLGEPAFPGSVNSSSSFVPATTEVTAVGFLTVALAIEVVGSGGHHLPNPVEGGAQPGFPQWLHPSAVAESTAQTLLAGPPEGRLRCSVLTRPSSRCRPDCAWLNSAAVPRVSQWCRAQAVPAPRLADRSVLVQTLEPGVNRANACRSSARVHRSWQQSIPVRVSSSLTGRKPSVFRHQEGTALRGLGFFCIVD